MFQEGTKAMTGDVKKSRRVDPSRDAGDEVPAWMVDMLSRVSDRKDRLERYKAESHISAADHSYSRRLELGKRVMQKTRIYLDQKYWIYCRDAIAGRPLSPEHAEIAQTLSDLASSGRIVCPITYPIWSETMKQGVEKRRATATIVDSLSHGITIQPFPFLYELELHHFFLSCLDGKDKLEPLENLVWTFAGCVLGEAQLDCSVLEPAITNALQKCMFDTFAVAKFSNLIDAHSLGKPPHFLEEEPIHQELNKGAESHRHEVTSFDTVFMSEVAGFLGSIRNTITMVQARVYTGRTGKPALPADSDESKELTRMGFNLIYHAYRLKKLTTQFPALHIGAGLHAAIRYRKQPYHEGDLWDFRHAHPALAYCDAFFTDKGLGNLLTQSPLRYNQAYNCLVLWKDTEIINYLRNLASAP